jgi:hypothetical protein
MLIGHVPVALVPFVFDLVLSPEVTQDCNAHEFAPVPPSWVELVAVVAVVAVAAFPVMLMGHVPVALLPEVFALPLSPVVTQACNAHELAAVPPREDAFVAVVALPALPVMLIGHVPEALFPVVFALLLSPEVTHD